MYTLITVTYGGEVGHSRGYETLYMCEQAKSLALTGMTIEQNKAAEDEQERWKKESAARWRAAHPPRVPKTKEELKLVEDAKRGNRLLGSSGPFSTVGEDGLIYDWPGSVSGGITYSPNEGEAIAYVRGQAVRKYRHDVKHAECVIEPEKPTVPL